MALTLTVFPQDARRRSLPVRCRIQLRRDDQELADANCDAKSSRAFSDLDPNTVYAVTVSGQPFAMTPAFVPVQSQDRPFVLFCPAETSRARLKQPVPYIGLPDALQTVLEASLELDFTNAKERINEREASKDRPIESRSLSTRDLPKDRSLPTREARNIPDGQRRWQSLSDEEHAGLLNLYSKMTSFTLFPVSGPPRTVWTYVMRLMEVARDRIMAKVDPDLKKQADISKAFNEVKELPIFHHPRANYSRSGSWKSCEPFGNLQLTFSESNEDPKDMELDADVDDAAGFGHVEQVLRNEGRAKFRTIFGSIIPGLPEGTSHPYEIHQILMHHQRPLEGLREIGPYVPNYQLVLRGAPPDYEL
jgi:hypothetical protein